MPNKSNKAGFADTDLQIQNVERYPNISDDIQQTLARLLGFDAIAARYKALLVDPDGRLYVSTSATQGSAAVNSQVTVSLASVQLVASNQSRKSVYIQNLGTAPIYINYGNVAIAASAFQIPAGGIFIEDRYTGQINAISGTAGQDVRIIEI